MKNTDWHRCFYLRTPAHNMPRLLFVTTRIGFGHQKVTDTMVSAVKQAIPECIVKIVSYFDFFPPRFGLLINRIYLLGLQLFPHVFSYIYLKQKSYKGRGVGFWVKVFGKRYGKIIKSFSPDLVVITQGLACQWFSLLKRKGIVNIPLISVITDFCVHPFWVREEIDQYIVSDSRVKEDLIKRGVAYEKIAVLGIPIDPQFGQDYNRDELKRKFGLKEGVNTVLVMGGGWGLGRLDSVTDSLCKVRIPLQLLVVTGNNEKLFKGLKRKHFAVPVHLYGKVDNVSELMAVADLVVTKPGGVTIAELLARGLPAVLWDVIPGQEKENSRYLVNAGCAIQVNRISDIPERVNELFSDPDRMARMKKVAQELGRPDAAVIAGEVIAGWLGY